MKLKLKEIIWEITGKCQNGCTYCGSKENWKEDIDCTRIKKIADRISEYSPDEIDISGGDPLLVPFETHQYICDLLNSRKVKCKILINPLSLKNTNGLNISKLYQHIGVSVNTPEELEHLNYVLLEFSNVTIITNYNVTNFFLHDKIAKAIKGKNIAWQIQFTMYQKTKDPFALYNYPEAIEILNESIGKHKDIPYIFADNTNDGPCTAGLSSLGILSNGDVVPCLSMRSWNENIKLVTEGNILSVSLKDLWMTRFIKNRFDDTCLCCKDICNKQILKYPSKSTLEIEKTNPIDEQYVELKIKERYERLNKINYPLDILYPQNPPAVYPQNPPAVMAYAVSASPYIGQQYAFTSANGNAGEPKNYREDNVLK